MKSKPKRAESGGQAARDHLASLRTGDRAFVEKLAKGVGVDPAACVAALLSTNQHISTAPSVIHEGSFTRLCLSTFYSELESDGIDIGRSRREAGGSGTVVAGEHLDLGLLEGLRELCFRTFDPGKLDLGKSPLLESIVCDKTGLAELDVSGNSRLEVLDASFNRFENLSVTKNPALRVLKCSDSKLGALDVSRNPELVTLHADSCDLAALDVSRNPKLETLWARWNALASIELPSTGRLESLFLSNSPLRALDLSKQTRLKSLLVGGTALETIDLTHSPALMTLFCDDTPMKELDLRHNRWLSRLKIADRDRLKVVHCTERQAALVPELRARAGIELSPAQRKMVTRFELHEKANHHNWDDGLAPLKKILKHELCDRSTALLVYWRGQPNFYRGYAKLSEALPEDREIFRFLLKIEEDVGRRVYKERIVPYSAQDDGGLGHDLTRDGLRDDVPVRREIPAAMCAPYEEVDVPTLSDRKHLSI